MNVKLIRMWSGEDVVADLINEDESSITIVNPIEKKVLPQSG